MDVLRVLDTSLGKQLSESAFNIITVVGLALISWEVVNISVERYLTEIDTEGTPRTHRVIERRELRLGGNAWRLAPAARMAAGMS